MARHKFQSTVRETLSTMLNDPDIQNSLGVAKFSKKARGVFCKIYIRKGRIYSVFATDISPDYITRLFQSGDLSTTNLEIVKKSFNSDLRHHGISEFLIDRHMVSAEVMENVKQDFFLDMFEKIIEWDEVNADWIANETTDVLKIVSVSYDRILELLDNRKNFLLEIAEKLNVDVSALESLTFGKIKESGFDADTPIIYHQLFSLADYNWNIQNAAVNFGLTNFKALQALFDLWKHNFVSIKSEGILLPDNIIIVVEEKQDVIKVEPVIVKVEPAVESEPEPQAYVTAGYVNLDEKENAQSIYVNHAHDMSLDNEHVVLNPVDVHINPEFENYSEPNYLEISGIDIPEKNSVEVDVPEAENADNKIEDENSHQIVENETREESVNFILPKIEDEQSSLVGRIRNSRVTPPASPVVLKSTKSIANNESNKVKLDVLKEQKNLLLQVLQNDLEYKEEEDQNLPLEETSDELTSGELTVEQTIQNDENVEELSSENINEDENVELTVIVEPTIVAEVSTQQEDNTQQPYKEKPVDNTTKDATEFDFSDMIDKITSQLRERKEYISELERSVTFDETELKTLQDSIEKKKEKIATQKREYELSIEKLKFL